MKLEQKQPLVLIAILIIAAAFSRLIPHPPNFAPIVSLALFGGAVIKNKKYALALPFFALILSDVLFELFTTTPGFYGVTQLFVYGAYILITFMATKIKKVNTVNMLFACVWSGVLFFLLSNLGVWASSELYPRNFNGLMQCFAAAIPFYKNEFFGNLLLNTITSNIFYTTLLFAVYGVFNHSFINKNATVIAK
jgi:hypothetical protein